MPRYTLGIDVGDGLFVVMDNGVDTKAIASAKAVFSDSVEIKDGEFHGGEFHGGWFRGGEFHGGEFHGGVFHGGVFRGGWFHGGEFHGGWFRGGVFHGGVFHGGVFRGGWFHGGEFHGGWLPVQIQGSKAFVNCPDGEHIKIGCQAYTPEHWAEHYVAIGKAHGYSDEQIEEYKGYIDLVSAMIAKSKSKGE